MTSENGPSPPLHQSQDIPLRNDCASRTGGIEAQELNVCSPPSDVGERISSPISTFTPTDLADMSPQMGTLPEEWERSEGFIHNILNSEDMSPFSFDNQQLTSVVSELNPTRSMNLLDENSPEGGTYSDAPTPGMSENLAIVTNEQKSSSCPQFEAPWGSPEMDRVEEIGERDRSNLTARLIDLPSELVTTYFNIVCPILSTFDSDKNVFRTFMLQKWQSSLLLFYTIQSMAAAKMVWFMPEMKTRALEYQSLALSTLNSDISRAYKWNSELLFAVLLLGISSCWFDIKDLGICHLEAVQQAIVNKKVDDSDDFYSVDFLTDALVYWEMVSCVVDDSVTIHDYSKMGSPRSEQTFSSNKLPSTNQARIKPHPWTGISSEPQFIFTRVARQIRSLRSYESTFSPRLDSPGDVLNAVQALDEEIWACKLPGLHDISNIGDENTPAIHHLLLAEAYMFANLYQLYSIFSSVRQRRVNWVKKKPSVNCPNHNSWAEDQLSLWAFILQQEDGTSKWLKFLGRNVIIRIEQIQTNSGTSCVQALLLLVAATSLTVSLELGDEDEEQNEILQARQFVLNRLALLSESNLSEPIKHVRCVVLEIFKRLDLGVDVFWMDVLQSVGTLTIIG
ncbi:hypothetical protein Plec18167_005204 [Paecilomyces lecythidis]|uniref:Transcription factor domain-containing protein n=1 Tax=Paecilomyces lecythidis TaxID=3004212 RepID=A0ABR3XM71_9EURO